MEINFDNNYVYINFKDSDTIAYTIEKNQFEENTGLTVSNITFPIPVYLIALSAEGETAQMVLTNGTEYEQYKNIIIATENTTLSCGSIVDNVFLPLKSQDDNVIVIVDFDGVEEVSKHFCQQYMQYLLTTKNKVITINQNINVSNIFANYVLSNIELQELEE